MLEKKTIISTRPISSDDLLIHLLDEAGARYISLPMIAIEINELVPHEKKLLLNLEQFDWVIFTSMNGVRFFFEHLNPRFKGKGFPKNIRTAVIGNSTKKALDEFGIEATLVNTGNTSSDLLLQLQTSISKKSKSKILLPLGNLAGDILEKGLETMANCTRINVYKTVPTKTIDSQIIQKIIENQYDMILLSSPSAFENLSKCLTPSQVLNLNLACIGTITKKAVMDFGVDPKIVAEKSTAVGLFESVRNYFEFNHIK